MTFCPACRGEPPDDPNWIPRRAIAHKMDCSRDQRIWAATAILAYEGAQLQEIADGIMRAMQDDLFE